MPRKLNDLSGHRFGRLQVVRRHGTSSKPVKWQCLCDCGKTTVVAYKHLQYGSTVSCGCYRADMSARTVHGHAGGVGSKRSGTYITWEGIKQRCHNPNANGYGDYGGRGIRVCDSWRSSFESFLSDMGERPSRTTLERIDNDGNYEPGNCRWAATREQASNRRNTRLVEHAGRRQTLTQWANEYGLPRGVLWQRLCALGWPMDRALETPVRRKNATR